MFVFKNQQRNISIKFTEEPLFARYLFLVSYILFIGLTLASYQLLGIPLFNKDSRLATYTSSGFGFIYRMSPVLGAYSLFYIIHLFFSSNSAIRRLLIIILIIPIIIIGVLSGSRSSFLIIIISFWGYRTFFTQNEPKLKDYKWLVILFILLAIVSFSIQRSGSFGQSGFLFLQRIVASGDLYWESLPKETWKSVVVERPFEYIFMGFLGPLRILDSSQAEIPIGFQLTNIIYPAIAGRSTGPVALFPIFGLVCFGYIGGCIFSFFQALFASFLFKMSFVKSNSIIASFMCFFAFNSFMYLIGDISAALSLCLDLLISFLLMGFLLIIIAIVVNIRNNYICDNKNCLSSEVF